MYKNVIIENSSVCNLRCIMCPMTFAKNENKGIISDAVFNKILPNLKGMQLVQLTGFGEPLLDKKIFNRIKQIKKYGCQVVIISNGILLNNTKIKNILNCGIDFVRFSFDGATKTTYEEIRKNSNYKKVIQNIKNLIKEKNVKKCQLKIGFIYIIMKRNISEVMGFVDLANSLNIDEIIFMSICTYTTYNKNEKCSTTDLIQITNQAQKKFKGKITINFDTKSKSSYFLCPFIINKTAYITNKGKVFPCSQLPYPIFWDKNIRKKILPKWAKFGNVFNNTLNKIWEKTEYKDFRNKWSMGIIPDECKYCNYLQS